jgi:tetratricopeptide (TPR) repeat protein
MKSWCVLFFCFLPLWAWAQPTEADTQKAKALFEAATVYYEDKDYAQALRGYQDAYKVAPLPFILFNIAQCYRFLGRYQEAHDAYDKFLRDDPNTEYRAEVEEKIKAMEIAIAENPPPATVPATTLASNIAPPPEKPSFKPVLYTAIPAAALGSIALVSYSKLRENKSLANGLGIPVAIGADVLMVVSLIKLRNIHKERAQ